MIETFIVFLCAILAGIFSGLMPGVGGLVVMSIAFPFLMEMDPVNILVFYIVLISIDQYFNGITAIIFALPGSSMNVPTLIEGHALFKNGSGGKAVMYAALGSWFASIFSVLLIIALLPILYSIYGIWTTLIQAILFGIATATVILVSRNNVFVSILFFLLGGTLAQVGYDLEKGEPVLTFGFEILYNGIPTMPLLASLFVLPVLITNYHKKHGKIEFVGVTVKGYIDTILDLKHYWVTLVRSSFLGSIGGFVPGLSYAFSSIFSYTIERWIRQRKNTYNYNGDVNCLIASESANNAGAFTQMIPLLFLGIPITASEALIYNILVSRGLPIDIEWFSNTFETIVVFFVISATIGMLLAGKYVNLLKVLNGVNIGYLYIGIMSVLIVLIYLVGTSEYSGIEYVIIAACLVPLGLCFVGRDSTPLIFGFILHEPLYDAFYRIYALYF
jgi:TctA family transporter